MSLPFYLRAAKNGRPDLSRYIGHGGQSGLTGPIANQGYTHELERDPDRFSYSIDDVPDFIRITGKGNKK